MSKNPQSSFDFGGSFIDTAPKIEAPKLKQYSLDWSKVPTMQHDQILSELKELINAEKLKQTDKYFRLSLSYEPIIKQYSEVSNIFPYHFHIHATHWSDSAIYLDVFNDGGAEMKSEDFLNRCDQLGAYTKTCWKLLYEDQSLTPEYFIDHFHIRDRIKPTYIGAADSIEECKHIIEVLIEWNRNHIKPIEEMVEDKTYNFIRITRKKGEIESTKCMNGECIGVIFAREMNF